MPHSKKTATMTSIEPVTYSVIIKFDETRQIIACKKLNPIVAARFAVRKFILDMPKNCEFTVFVKSCQRVHAYKGVRGVGEKTKTDKSRAFTLVKVSEIRNPSTYKLSDEITVPPVKLEDMRFNIPPPDSLDPDDDPDVRMQSPTREEPVQEKKKKTRRKRKRAASKVELE